MMENKFILEAIKNAKEEAEKANNKIEQGMSLIEELKNNLKTQEEKNKFDNEINPILEILPDLIKSSSLEMVNSIKNKMKK